MGLLVSLCEFIVRLQIMFMELTYAVVLMLWSL